MITLKMMNLSKKNPRIKKKTSLPKKNLRIKKKTSLPKKNLKNKKISCTVFRKPYSIFYYNIPNSNTQKDITKRKNTAEVK